MLLLPAVAAAPKPDLWARWQQHDAASAASVDHRLWDDFLSANLVAQGGIALIPYGDVSAADKQSLKRYIEMLSHTDVDLLNRAEQFAFWVNAYNALTVDLIIDEYPVKSIRDISGGLFSPGPWDDDIIRVAGETLTLNDIEHRILRPIWQDARVHYAVNCASIGCPNLAAVAFTAANADSLLDAGARDYINHPRGAAVRDGKLIVSSIYEWFGRDFGGSDASIIAHLKTYADDDLRADLESISNIADDQYDWNLNAPK